MSEDSIQISVLIPAYNEEKRIGGTLDILQEYFAKQSYRAEILVVSDGSTDQTVETVEAGYPDVRMHAYETNRGKGYATRVGGPLCTGEFVLIYDADGSTPIDDVEKLWPKFEEGFDIVIGSRSIAGSDVQIRQPLYRQSMGRIYNLLLRLLGLTTFKDTQCGFKGVRATCIEPVFSRMRSDGFGADCEMLYIAGKLGYRIADVPIRWLNSLDTRVHAIFDSLDMIREVLIIRGRASLGQYR
ncbi:MAG: dolichyl-phosphate beta-glucosyltransferase [Candidatus Hydrogenedentota bacterium]